MTSLEELFDRAQRRYWLLSYADLVERRRFFNRQCGIYIWYFRKRPGKCPTRGCVTVISGTFPFRTKWKMMYIGRAGYEGLSKRVIDWHFDGDQSVGPSLSTLRESLAALMEYQIIETAPGRYALPKSSQHRLSAWMRRNARVLIHPTEDFAVYENALIRQFNPPLNIAGCENKFTAHLQAIRSAARRRARELN